jgi:hypothetical protein
MFITWLVAILGQLSLGQVISNFSYKVDGQLHILGQIKSLKAFDHFIGELMKQM